MPRYYCDYCDTYLTHDSPSVRKQHNAGYKHKANVRSYYQQFEEQQTQSLIDQRIKEHLGQTAAFQQVGAAYNQHLTSFPANPQRPRLPILPTPVLPTGAPQVPGTSPLIPGIRPPVLPRPVAGPPGYAVAPSMPSVLGPSGTPLPMPVNGLPRPPTINAPTTVPGGTAAPAPTSNGAPSMVTPAIYQANPTTATSGGFDSFNTTAASGLQRPSPSGTTAPLTTSTASQDGFTYGQNAEPAGYDFTAHCNCHIGFFICCGWSRLLLTVFDCCWILLYFKQHDRKLLYDRYEALCLLFHVRFFYYGFDF